MKERTEKKERRITHYVHVHVCVHCAYMYLCIHSYRSFGHIHVHVHIHSCAHTFMFPYVHVSIHSCFHMFMFPYIHGIVYLATNNTCTIHTLYMCCDLHVCCSNDRGLGRAELMSELLTLIERVKKCADDLRLEETAYDEVR